MSVMSSAVYNFRVYCDKTVEWITSFCEINLVHTACGKPFNIFSLLRTFAYFNLNSYSYSIRIRPNCITCYSAE